LSNKHLAKELLTVKINNYLINELLPIEAFLFESLGFMRNKLNFLVLSSK